MATRRGCSTLSSCFCLAPSVPSPTTVSAEGVFARSPRLRRRRGASLTAPLPSGRGRQGHRRQAPTQWCTILAESWHYSSSGHSARVVYAREERMAEPRTPSMLQVFNEHFERAARYVKAPADLLEYIRSCHS